MQGKVKWFSSEKGYGFITSDESDDYFVHYTNIQEDGFRTLEEGERVEFEVGEGKKRPQAVAVRRTGA